MERLRWLVIIYDWVARVHFALFGVGGVGMVGAAVAFAFSLPPISVALAIIGFAAIAFGVVGWWASKRSTGSPSGGKPEGVELVSGVVVRSTTASTRVAPVAAEQITAPRPPPRLIAKQQQLAMWRTERDALVERGDNLANELRLLDVDATSQKKIEKIFDLGKTYLADVKDHRGKWWSGLPNPFLGHVAFALTSFARNPVPGPEWRAQLVARIEDEAEWLRQHGPQ